MNIAGMKIGARPLAAATAVLFLFGLAGLATIDEDTGSTRITAAAATTTDQKTARMAMVVSFGVGSQQSSMTGEGVVDLVGNRARMTLRSPLLPGPMEVLVDGATAYVNAAGNPQFAAVAGGKAWVAIDSAAAASALGGNSLGASNDPMQWFRLLEDEGVAFDVRENGAEDVRGVRTTRYVGDLDVAAMFEALDSPQAENMAALARDATGEVEVWLGDDDVVRRSVFRMTFTTGGQSFSTTVTVELFDFGVAVDVAPPPADQVHRLG